MEKKPIDMYKKVNCLAFPERVQRPYTKKTYIGKSWSKSQWLSIKTYNNICQEEPYCSECCDDEPYRKIYDSNGKYIGWILGNSAYEMESWICCWVLELFSNQNYSATALLPSRQEPPEIIFPQLPMLLPKIIINFLCSLPIGGK